MSPKVFIRSKLPLAALGAGAGAMFLANIAAKKLFTSAQFVDWAYLTSLTALFFSFSLLGAEQLIVRSAHARDGRLELPKQVARYIAVAFTVFLATYVFVLDGRIFSYRLGAATVPVLLSVGAIQIVYQLERSRGHLLASQFALNAWKYALLPLVLASLALQGHRAEFAMAGALVIGLACVIVVYGRARSTIVVRDVPTDAARVMVPFMISLGLMGALNIVDRVVLEKIHRPEAFAGYVYLTTILATPFNILSAYFGFKDAVRYRMSFSLGAARKDSIRTLLLAGALYLGWCGFCYLTRPLSGVTFDPAMWILLGLLSAVRCGYGVLSAAMGVRGSARAIYLANAASVASIVAFALGSFATRAPVTVITAGFVAIWGVRFVAYFWFLGVRPTEVEDRRAAEAA